MKLLIVIPFNAENAAQAEKLIDHLFNLNGRKPAGAALLVAGPGTSPEAIELIKISGAIAFEHFRALKTGTTTELYKPICDTVRKLYRTPFLWLSPDFMPTAKNWMKQIETAYFNQPMRFWLKTDSAIGVHPFDADGSVSSDVGSADVVFETITRKA